MKSTKQKKKKISNFRIRLRTKNHSAESLKDKLYTSFYKKPVIVRLGSLTPIESITSRADVLEINKTDAIEISRNKKEMKEAFNKGGVKTANWWKWEGNFINSQTNENTATQELPYPIISKSLFGQGGVGNTLHKDQKSLQTWMKGKDLDNYIFEQYYNYAREYRLHVTKEGNFLSWRKLRKKDAKERWYFNSDNCVWIGENNPLFDKPINWEEIQKHSIKACESIGLDICAVDVRVQSSINDEGDKRENCDFIILETNSAPSLGEKGSEFYYNQILKIINK